MQRRQRARNDARLWGAAIALASLSGLTGCAMFQPPPSTPFEMGAVEFQAGDELAIDRLTLDGDEFEPGATIHIEGRYRLGSRGAATLYLGTTAIHVREASFEEDEPNRVQLNAGEGSFTLSHRIPARGYPHLTFYDATTGAPFGGVYFGRGESVLHERDWSYDH